MSGQGLIIFSFIASLVAQGLSLTTRPIIGIVCHELSVAALPDCYISASYVKAVETAGARVVPIFLSRDHQYYSEMVSSLNGVVFPGGSADPKTKGGYFDAAAAIFSIARRINYQGDHFPILGVCLGFEFLAILSNDRSDTTLVDCPGMMGSLLSLQFLPGAVSNSSLYRSTAPGVLDILASQKVTINYHKFCLRPKTTLRNDWQPLTLNQDSSGKDFVSSMEMRGPGGPMAAIQFHPEKAAFEWQEEITLPSYKVSLLANRHFFDWLVTEARLNSHSFRDPTREVTSLIYNFSPTYTAVLPGPQSRVTQAYIFRNITYWSRGTQLSRTYIEV